ncbi:MAG: NAD(P)-dependent oxidoreductase [Patescibacteria group bacterium]|mgnify:CR=1 FL=1
MKKIFMIGGSGLVGSRVVELLSKNYIVDQFSLESGVDITDPTTLGPIRNDKEHELLIHMAAKADVDGCEADRLLGEDGSAYKINVLGTQNVLDACLPTNKKFIYISTDFVFDGENAPEGGYTEEDDCNPVNWYAQTKYLGEEHVRESSLPFIIARLAYPFRKDAFAVKKDFVHAIMDRLSTGQEIRAVTDHVMSPTYIDDIAFALDKLITSDSQGIYHIVGGQSLTPYEASLLIAERFGYDRSLISETTRAEYFSGKAPRPYNIALNNNKITELGLTMRSFSDAIHEVSPVIE